MSSRAEYLKKYLSTDKNEEKKKKKKKSTKLETTRTIGMRLIEEDAFLSVEAAKQKEFESDEEREEIEVLKESVKKAKVVPGFKKTFAEVEVKKEVKEEPLTPDQSPSRDNSPPRRRRHDSDNSPTRPTPSKRQRHDSDNSPPRSSKRQRHDSDNSPPRRNRNASPVRRKRHDSDESPPRNTRRQRHDSDNSPPRRKRHDSDNSPPRRRNDDKDNSPPRRKRLDSDNSPSRRRNDDKDNSPPRRKRHDSDNSPPRRRNEDRDSSPPRRKRHDSDNSPPRRGKEDRRSNRRKSRSPETRKIAQPVRVKNEIDSDEERGVGKTLDGKRSGLQTAKALREESDKLKAKNEKLFDEMDTSVSGRDAETVYRQKQTKKKGKDTEEEKAKKEREAKKTEELKEKYKDWNRGAAQIEERRAQLEEMARVAAEPMTRRQDDVEMNRHLKEVLHESDPMANIIRKKKRDTAIDQGELVYPTYQGTWVPNRFGIAPGYRWDGVDRSNGFEGKLARTANQKTANQSEYYKSIAEYE